MRISYRHTRSMIFLTLSYGALLIFIFSSSVHAICGRKSCVVGPSTGGSTTPSFNIPFIPLPQPSSQQQNWQIAGNFNQQGIVAFNNGNYEFAIQHFKNALRYAPNNQNIQYNLQEAEKRLEEQQQADRERAEREAAAERERERAQAEQADRMRARLSEIGQKLQEISATGLNFDGARTGNVAPSGGLDFMPEPPAITSAGPVGPAAPPQPAGVDSSVVDLRHMADKPLVVDPRVVSGEADSAAAAPKSEAKKNISREELASQERIATAYRKTLTDAELAALLSEPYADKRWPGPTNPDAPLVNPLREPEVAKQLYLAGKAQLRNRMKDQASLTWWEKMDADEKFAVATARIIEAQMKGDQAAIDRAQEEMLYNIRQLQNKVGAKNILELQDLRADDPGIQKDYDLIVRQFQLGCRQGFHESSDTAFQSMTAEIEKYRKEHGGN